MNTPLIVLLAAIAMVATDVLGTIMVVSEARGRGWIAGWCDTAGWLVSITTTTISVSSLTGHDTARKVAVVLAVSAANLFGTRLGQYLGNRFVKPTDSLEARVAALETAAKP